MLDSIYTVISQLKSLQSLKREQTVPIENLVLEGGGVKGLAYAGALQVLAENNLLDTVIRVAGSSAGGIVALLLAVGHTPDEILKIMSEEINFKELMDSRNSVDPTRIFKAAGMPLGVSDLYMLFQHKGLYKGDKFLELAKMILKRKIEEKLKEQIIKENNDEIEKLKKNNDNSEVVAEFVEHKYREMLEKYYITDPALITFEQLNLLRQDYPDLKFKELYVTGTRVRDGKLKVFSEQTNPKMPVVLAIRITMSFPLGFEPVMFEGELYMDGGVADNYPMRIFDRPQFLSHGRNEANVNPATLGFLVDSKAEIQERWGVKSDKSNLHLSTLIEGILKGLQMRSEVLKQFYSTNSIQIFDEDVETMDFNLNPDTVLKLIFSGKKAMQNYIDNYRNDVRYHNLPDYQTWQEKIYSKTPQEITLMLENEMFPLLQECTTLLAVLKTLDISKELENLKNETAEISNDEYEKQKNIYDELEELANYCIYLERQLEIVKSESQLLNAHKKTLQERLESASSPLEREELNAQLEDYNAEIFFNEDKRKKITKEIKQKRESYQEVSRYVKKEVYEILNKIRILEKIQQDNLVESLSGIEEILHEQMDEVLAVIQASVKHYPDPRLSNFENQLYKIRQRKKREIQNVYQEQHFYSEKDAGQIADLYDEIFQDVLAFGYTLEQSQVYALHYLSVRNLFKGKEQELRIDFFKNLLIERLVASNIIKDTDEKSVEWFKKEWEIILNRILQDQTSERGYAEFLAKEQVLEKWNGLKQEKKLAKFLNLNYAYTANLQELLQLLSVGNWAGSINLTNENDTAYNATEMKKKEGETFGKHASSYQVNTVVYNTHQTYSYLSMDKKFKMPPIKAHVLCPEFSRSDKTDEIIVAFEQPGQAEKESQFSLISKHSKNRETQFEEHKNAILQQIKFALRQVKEKRSTKSGKVCLTIVGEGLAGQDAQMLFSAIIKQLNEGGAEDILQEIGSLDLKLIDPCRVSNKLKRNTKKQIKKLKTNRPLFALSGFNLIHQKSYAGVTKKRKPRNYIGEANILSGLSVDETQVVAEFRDLVEETHLYKRLDNSNSDKLEKALNKKNALFAGILYRKLSSGFKQFKVLSQGLFNDSLPYLTKMLLALPFQVGKGILRRTTSPLYRLYRLFKKSKPSLIEKVNWQAVSIPVQEQTHGMKSWETRFKQILKQLNHEQRLSETERPPLENLVLAGGMGKGATYAGALIEMQNKGMLNQVKRVAGSSEGGLVAALYAIGFEAEELAKLMMNEFNSKTLQDEVVSLGGLDKLFTIKGIDVTLSGIVTALAEKGLYKGEALEKLLQNVIKIKLENKVKKLLYENLTKEELASIKGDNEKIEAFLQIKLSALKQLYGLDDLSDITLGQLKTLSSDFPTLNIKDIYLTGTSLQDASLKIFSYEQDPNIPLVKAIRITCSTPGKYVPVAYDEKYYVSGNIANDYPIEVFDQAQFLSHGLNDAGANPCSFGLMINEEAYRDRWGGKESPKSELTLGKFINNVLKGMYARASIISDKYTANTLILSEKFKTSSKLKRLLFFGKKHTREESQSMVDMGRAEVNQYHTQYMGKEVIYSQKKYQNTMHKYYAKTSVENQRILEQEILPLQAKLQVLINEAKENVSDLTQDANLYVQLQNAYQALLDEEQVLIRALALKGIQYKKLDKRSMLPINKERAIIQSLPHANNKKLRKNLHQSPLLTAVSSNKQPFTTKSTPRSFIREIFKDVFPESHWHYQSQQNNHTFSSKNTNQNKIQIEEDKEKLSFYGKPTQKIVESAKTYEKWIMSKNQILTFEIKARTLEDAYTFLRELSTSGFAIEEIQKIKITDSPVLVDVKKVIQEVRHQLRVPSIGTNPDTLTLKP